MAAQALAKLPHNVAVARGMTWAALPRRMVLALLLVLIVLGAGSAVGRALGLGTGPASVGSVPALGLAALCVISTAFAATGLPPPASGLAVLLTAACGAVVLVRHTDDVRATLTSAASNRRGAAMLLGLALLVPLVVLATAFRGVEAPLSTHDGAFHVEVIDGLRRGGPIGGWYPPGIEAGFAAILQLAPWRDTAAGSFELALGLSVLAPLLVFGLAVSASGDVTLAGLAALFAAVTYLFSYFVQIWSGWPLQAATLMLLGLWTLCSEYIKTPTRRWSVAGGLLVGSIVVTHGSELISAALVLAVLVAARWRRLVWRRVFVDVAVAVAVAVVCAAPYLPELTRWAAGGGASSVGYAEAGALDAAAQTAAGGEPLRVFALDALGIDLPLRVVLLVAGLYWVFRRRVARSLVVVALVFAALAAAFSFFSSVPLVRLVYAVTYPWGLPYRLFLIDAVVIAVLAAAGGVWLTRAIDERLRQTGRERLRARLTRAGRVMLGAWLVVATFAMTIFVSFPVAEVSSFTPDDAVAMAWLRQNAEAGMVVVNDGYADAGIWTPYKAGLPIVMPRLVADPPAAMLVVDNITRLDAVSEARDAACRSGARYVYSGAKNTGWQARTFPPLADMLAAPTLERVFSSGEATVFRLRLSCPPGG